MANFSECGGEKARRKPCSHASSFGRRRVEKKETIKVTRSFLRVTLRRNRASSAILWRPVTIKPVVSPRAWRVGYRQPR